jgi:hypothetical protein
MAVSNSSLAATTFVPIPTYLFSATVTLGKTLGPISLLEGGKRVVEVITGGIIYGPGFNATIEGGLAAPIVVATADGTQVQIPYIYAYGVASDGAPFYMEESGLGSTAVQNTRLSINVGGKYEALQTTYVLGQPSLNADKTLASVHCFSIPLPP